jgi:type I restriction enzyme R subunit
MDNLYNSNKLRVEKISEADTRVKIIDPLLRAAGWTEENIRREFHLKKGKIFIEGNTAKRGEKKFVDYLLYYKEAFPIAVIEAKSRDHHWANAISDAKEKAQILGVLFAYSTNGEKFEEFDYTTNQQTTLDKFPSPEDLYQRWRSYTQQNLIDWTSIPEDKNPFFIPLYYDPQKEPRYYQLQAINKVIEAILKGQKKILLQLATGTGKTYVASQIVWKLWKSKYLRKILYLTDRAEVLRDQACNEFKAFGDVREKIIEGKAPQARDIYFATYQALYSGDESHRLYQNYNPDFFDMVIIDECHRSGWNRWFEILQYFKDAIHLGMTATPKRTDNIDTYQYFGEPVYKYEIEQGIEDGYLANYQVQRIYTNLVEEGLNIKEAQLKGAEIFIPEDDPEVVIKDIYYAPDFERTITIPEHTKKICQKICELLERYGNADKTIIYCVTIDHAADVKKYIQEHFAYLGHPNYAVRIVADDEIDKKELENFRDSEKQLPVVATTVDLLTTGVDVPSVKNIIILKPISSVVMFNQIIGRGTRIDEASGKLFFRIIDFTGATRLFTQLIKEKPPIPAPQGPFDCFYKAQVFDAENGQPISDVRVVLSTQAHSNIIKKTDQNGAVFFDNLPHSQVLIRFEKTGYNKKELKVQPTADFNQIETVTLSKEKDKRMPIKIEGIDVYIATEEEFLLEAGGKKLSKAEYREYSKRGIRKKVVNLEDLRTIWLDDEKREEFIRDLVSFGISPQVLATVILNRSDVDGFDVIAHVAFDAPIISRDERARALIELKQKFINSFPTEAREIIFDLIEQYKIGGIDELKPEVFNLWKFVHKYDGIQNIIQRLKTKELQPIFNQLKEQIYG